MKLETTKDILQALVDGKKIRWSTWPHDHYIHVIHGCLMDEKGDENAKWFFENTLYGYWELYQSLRCMMIDEEFEAALDEKKRDAELKWRAFSTDDNGICDEKPSDIFIDAFESGANWAWNIQSAKIKELENQNKRFRAANTELSKVDHLTFGDLMMENQRLREALGKSYE